MGTIEEAGAIVIKPDPTDPKVLLLTSKRNRAHWIFPKGHVEDGETLEEAALREAAEEAGVRGAVFGRAGCTTYQLGADTYRVQYFLVTTEDEGAPEHGRRIRWCSYGDALQRLTFDDLRGVLREAWPQVAR